MTPFRPGMGALESEGRIANNEIVIAKLLIELQQQQTSHERLCTDRDEALRHILTSHKGRIEELAIRFKAANQYQGTTRENLNSLIHHVNRSNAAHQESMLNVKSGLRILESRSDISSGSVRARNVSNNLQSDRHLIN